LPLGGFPFEEYLLPRGSRGVTTADAASLRVGVDFEVFQPCN
jgi:hypothetical protein